MITSAQCAAGLRHPADKTYIGAMASLATSSAASPLYHEHYSRIEFYRLLPHLISQLGVDPHAEL